MALVNPALPVIGSPNATEDPKILGAIVAILATLNGAIDTANIADNGVGTSEIANSAVTSAKIVDGTIQLADLGFRPIQADPSGSGTRVLRGISLTTSAAPGWGSAGLPWSFGNGKGVISASVMPSPGSGNGASIVGFSTAGFDDFNLYVNFNSTLAQNITFIGFALTTT